MGLDQYAYTRSHDQKPNEVEPAFVWRKHAKLQEWAEQLFVEKTEDFVDQLNCNELILKLEDIEHLERLVLLVDLVVQQDLEAQHLLVVLHHLVDLL